jgi:OOP family OmpA-OmpF porin
MAVESVFRKARAALAAGACALVIGAIPAAQAQVPAHVPATKKSPAVGSVAPDAVSAGRIVLHGLRFQAHSDKIDKFSVPMLDYAVQIIKENPESLIYVKVRSVQHRNSEMRSSELTNRRAQAVTSYLVQKGISAKRLVLLGSGSAPYTLNQDAGKIQNLKDVEVVQLDFTTEAGQS